jgi:hypothetical protein
MLQDANDAKRAPVACVSAAVRAVEAMLAEKGYSDRKMGLMGRIQKAVSDGLLPGVMEHWALEVREIGTGTHTDQKPAPLPDAEEAEAYLSYANLLASYLFTLPAVIEKNRAQRGAKRRGETQKEALPEGTVTSWPCPQGYHGCFAPGERASALSAPQ